MLERVDIGHITGDDIELLLAGLSITPVPFKVLDILTALGKDLMQFWRFNDGLIITTLLNEFGNKSCVIWLVIGKGYIKQAPELIAEITAWAKAEGCKYLECRTQRDGIGKIVEKLFNGKMTSVHYLKEI